jgi:asparagine synthase (glutamine-hydrolysing)
VGRYGYADEVVSQPFTPDSSNMSGGIDSSSIASVLFNDHGKSDLHTFSAVYGKGVEGDESDYIDTFGEQLKNSHYVIPNADSLVQDVSDFVATQAEAVSSTALYAQYKVMQLASTDVTVTLDGQGADEQLGGICISLVFISKTCLNRCDG